jgi:hypothetical protein
VIGFVILATPSHARTAYVLGDSIGEGLGHAQQ